MLFIWLLYSCRSRFYSRVDLAVSSARTAPSAGRGVLAGVGFILGASELGAGGFPDKADACAQAVKASAQASIITSSVHAFITGPPMA